MRRLIDSIKKTNLVCKQLAPECAAVNSRRTVYGSIAAIIVHAAHVVIYSLTIPHNGNEVIWHNGIVTTHSVMLAVMGIMLIYALMLRRRKKAGMPEYILQYLLISLLMAEGVVLTYFDQFITPSVTPYIILCLVSGIVFLMRPIYSLLIFALSYAAFFYAVGLEHIVRNVVLSNRTNGFAIASIGFGISYVMWRYNLLHIRQRSHIEAQQKKLMDMANLDPLTGLFNRRKFDEIIRQEIAFSTLSKRESSLIMLDIDFFKNINDSYGHPAGDSVLMQFSRLLKESIAGNDQICRVGGEEFIILMHGKPLSEAMEAAETLRLLVESHIFFVGEKSVRLTASFGASSLDYNNDPTLINQYSIVDKALYCAKQNGRNRVEAA